MKVYWSEHGGAVITSANLSANALGSGGLREAGVLFPPGAVSIAKLLAHVNARAVTNQMLTTLERGNKIAAATRRNVATPATPTFADARRGGRMRWLIAPFEGTVPAAERLKAAVKEDLPRGGPHSWLTVGRDEAKEGDFLLTLNIGRGARRTHAEWLFVQRKVLVAKRDAAYNQDNPFQVAQVFESRLCPPPPFRIDAAFKRALRLALKEINIDDLTMGKPPGRFIRAIEKHIIQA